MPWFGSWFGTPAPTALVLPNISNGTTADAIRDRAIEVVRSLIPTYVPGDRFVPYRNEGGGDFVGWVESNPASANRMFQIRFDGAAATPEVSNSDHEERVVMLTTIVAYAQNARTGKKQALDRDTAIDRDRDLLDAAIGLYSRPNFISPHPDASWFSGHAERVLGESVDLLVLTGAFRFRRDLDL